jgi:hypothetical protein
MHRSRVCAFVIDCQSEDVGPAAEFWGRALGKPVDASKVDASSYRELKTGPDEVILLVQKVDHPSRIHLDIETDDLDAEVRRLEVLGAKRVSFIERPPFTKGWWVMEAPTGHRFCVVQPQRGALGANANEWPDEPTDRD